MTEPSRQPAGQVRLDIRRVTLDGYSPGQRDHFARELQVRLTSRGAPEAVARRAVEEILAAVDARMGDGHG